MIRGIYLYMDEQTPEVYLGDDDLVHITFDGDLDEERASRIMDKMVLLCAELRKQGKLGLVLAHMTDYGDTSVAARDVIAKTVGSTRYDRVAAYGTSPFVKHIANFVVMATGAFDRARIFSTEEESRAWLTRE
jgi:hypothetical protein